MPTMSSVDPSYPYSMFKGEPGTRKSTCALSYPRPQYWFSYDMKMDSMAIPMYKWGINPEEIKFDDYRDWNTAKAKLEQLQINCPFKTIIIDSITALADMSLREVRKAKGGGRKIGGIEVNTIEDFNAEAAALNELIALTKDIRNYHKVNIILIAHVVQAEYKSADGETHHSRTIVTAAKKIAPKIPAYCHEVYHFNVKGGIQEGAGGKYSLLTEHTGDDFARTGLPLKKEIIFGDEPLYDKFILPAINELKNKKPTPQSPINPIK